MKEANMFLSTMMDGTIQRKFNKALELVMMNLQDEEIPSDKKRKISIELTFSEDEKRQLLHIEAEVKTKLVPQDTTSKKYWMSREYDEIVLEEADDRIMGQLEIDRDTGEIRE